MDWSRAKSILIAALIVVNLILTGVYYNQQRDKVLEIAASTDSAIEYLESKGIDVVCAVPKKTERVRVVTLRFKEGAIPGGLARTVYEDLPIEVLGIRSSDYIEAIQETDIDIEVLPAYTALLKSLESVSGEIDDLELIYLVDRTAYSGAGQDTALPYWKVSSAGNSYYYAAFGE